MSGFISEDWGWTDDEREAGIPSLWVSYENEGEQLIDEWPDCIGRDEPENLLKYICRKPIKNDYVNSAIAGFELGLSKIIYPLKSREEIQIKTVRKLINFGIDIAIRRYGREESLPRRYQLLAKNKSCLNLLLQDLFLRVQKINLTPCLIKKIESIVSVLEKKDESKIAYQKVSELRYFIHQIVKLEQGEGQEFLIHREEMRLLLSTARLHLCINELVKHHTADLITLQKRYISLSAIESFLPTANDLPGRRSIHRWRLRHYRSFLYYFPIEIRQALLDYMQRRGHFSSIATPNLEDYKNEIIAYCLKAIEHYLMRRNN